MKYFYSHIVSVETLTAALDGMDLSPRQKEHLARLVDLHIHQVILDLVFSQLTDKDKVFLAERLKASAFHRETLDFLKQRVDNVEESIDRAVKELRKELEEDIQEAKRTRN